MCSLNGFCRTCGKSLLIAVQIWSRDRLAFCLFHVTIMILVSFVSPLLSGFMLSTTLSCACQCIFPREVAKGIHTPMFILNPAYDVWQVQICICCKPFQCSVATSIRTWYTCRSSVFQVEHVLSPEGSDPEHLWQNCRLDITKCDSKQLETLQGNSRINLWYLLLPSSR